MDTTPREAGTIKAGDVVVWPYYAKPLVMVTNVAVLEGSGVVVIHCDRFGLPHVALPTATLEVPA